MERERERKKMERTKNRKREIGRRDELGFKVSKDCLNASLHHSENGNFLSCFL